MRFLYLKKQRKNSNTVKAINNVLSLNDTNWIDLGIRNDKGEKILFADRNIGASSPEDDGDLLTWDEAMALKFSDGNVRLPDIGELKQLIGSRVEVKFDENDDGTGKLGLLVTGKDDSASSSVFLPAAGYLYGGCHFDAGYFGGYWSSSLDESDPSYAWDLCFDGGDWYDDNSELCGGQSVRPVRVVASEPDLGTRTPEQKRVALSNN